MAGLHSPSVDNYYIGKGIVLFQPEGTTQWYDLGNIPEIEFEPTIETLDHFSSREGVRTKDKTIVLERGGELTIVMEEFSARNLSFLLMGSVNLTDPALPSIEIFSQNVQSGALRFYGTNEVGPRWNLFFGKVDFVPSASFNPISEEWGQMEVTAQVAQSGGSFGTATLTNLNSNNRISEFVADPAVTVSGTPKVGQTLTANVGSFIGDPSPVITYQWEEAGVVIVGATNSTYVPVTGDIGSTISVVVTITNSLGTDFAESASTAPVVA